MDGPYALVLGFSLAGLLGVGLLYSRSQPETLRRMALDALTEATAARATCEALKVECQAILDAAEGERERTGRDRARARSERQRVDEGRAAQPAPTDRGSILADLRRQAGMT